MSMYDPSVTDEFEDRVQEQQSPSIFMRLYSVIWWSVFAAFTFSMFVWTLICLPLLVIDPRGRWFHVLTVCFWGWAVYGLNPLWGIKVEGREKLFWDKRAVIVSNHDSLADILVMGATFRPFKFVSKKSVFAVPVLGWAMRINGYVEIQRGNAESVAKMFKACHDWLHKDVPVMMFPEGTRSKDGQVKPFKDGAFKLAMESGAEVCPVVLAGTAESLPKHGLIAPLRAHVRVKVLDPVNPAEFQSYEALRDHVRTVIIAEKAKLVKKLAEETAHLR